MKASSAVFWFIDIVALIFFQKPYKLKHLFPVFYGQIVKEMVKDIFLSFVEGENMNCHLSQDTVLKFSEEVRCSGT